MNLLFQKVDLSLQNSRPYICEGSSFETTEHPGYGPAHVHMEKNTCALHIKVCNLHVQSCALSACPVKIQQLITKRMSAL